MQLSDRPYRAASVVSRWMDGEAVLVHPEQGKVRVLNSVGARLWELADGERTIAEMARVVAQEYDVEQARAEKDAAAFCRDLVRRGLMLQASPV